MNRLNNTLYIGSFPVEGRLFLAPMAGVTDKAFRLICKRYGAAFTYTEMVSAKAMHYKDDTTLKLAEIDPEEGKAAVQLFGSEPEIIAEAAQRLSLREEIAFVDINMGCPAPKIVKNGEGSALMCQPDLVRQIVREAVKASLKPVTVKIRKGWDDASVNAVAIASICEEEGAAAVAVHGRTREQQYSGKADWEIIREVKKALHIPVIGNGDVQNGRDALNMMDFTGCDGVMIGRGALGNPWAFHSAKLQTSLSDAFQKDDSIITKPEPREIISVIKAHYVLMEANKGERTALIEMRKHVGWYLHGLPGAAKLRAQIFCAEDRKTVEKLLETYFQQ